MTTIVDINLLKKYDENLQTNVARKYVSKDAYSTDKTTFALKTEIPKKVSVLENDSNFISNVDASSLIANEISKIVKFEIIKVNVLPTTGEKGKIYVISNNGSDKNVFDEYIWIESTNKFELLGTKTIDLSGYALKTEIPTKVSELQNDSNFATKSYVDNATSVFNVVSESDSATFFDTNWDW